MLFTVALFTLFSIPSLSVVVYADNLSLPAPDLKGHMSLSSAINQSASKEELSDHQTEIQEVSQLLWAVQGITHSPDFRTVPSAGATYPLEVFVLHRGTSTLSEGCYRYIPQGHQIEEVSTSWNESEFLLAFDGDAQEAIANVSTVFVILAEYIRTTNRYGGRGVQYVHLEVGHAIQNFLLQATSLDLCTHIITQFESAEIQATLDTVFEPLVVLPLGTNSESSGSRLERSCSLSQYDEFTVEQAILERKSVRDYMNGSIPLSVLYDVLNDSTRIDYLVGSHSEVDIRVVIGQVEDLMNGTYCYKPYTHSLEMVTSGDQRSQLKTAGLGQDWIESAQLDIVMSVNSTWIHQQTDPTYYNNLMMFNIGMIAQNVYLKCAANGLGTVVIGAFYENDVSQVVGNPDGFKPIYIMPIGLTSEFSKRNDTYPIAMTDLARITGVIIFVPFYCSLYLSIPALKRRMPKKLRWLHCLFGFIPLLALIIHSMILHGHARSIWEFFEIKSWVNATIHWFSIISTIPISFYDLGQFAAYLCIPVLIVAAITGVRPIIKRRNFRKLHTPSVFVSLALMLTHVLTVVHSYFIRNISGFLLLNIGAICFYFLLKYYPKLVRKYREENSSMTLQDVQ